MNRIIFLIFLCVSSLSYGQVENRWQPDSIYSNRKVKKIFVSQNSPKDLSEIVKFDKNGKIKRIEKYSTSYNRRTRKSKTIGLISNYQYDSKGFLIKIIDSTIYYDNSFGIDKKVFEYDSNNRILSRKYYKGKFEKPYNVTKYSYAPFTTTTTRSNDSIVMYQKVKEYDKNFYVKRFYGFYLEPKLKKIKTTIDGITNTVVYSDKTDLQRFVDDKTIKNSFDVNGRLIKSGIKSVFMNDRINEFELKYEYYKNGLLKSVHGYVPRYFKYEFWE